MSKDEVLSFIKAGRDRSVSPGTPGMGANSKDGVRTLRGASRNSLPRNYFRKNYDGVPVCEPSKSNECIYGAMGRKRARG